MTDEVKQSIKRVRADCMFYAESSPHAIDLHVVCAALEKAEQDKRETQAEALRWAADDIGARMVTTSTLFEVVADLREQAAAIRRGEVEI